MPEQRRKFSPQFKAEAVQMVLETGKPIAEVARDLGINEGTLGNWVNIWRREHPEPMTELTPVERARVKEMEDEIRRLRMENEFLKKVVMNRPGAGEGSNQQGDWTCVCTTEVRLGDPGARRAHVRRPRPRWRVQACRPPQGRRPTFPPAARSASCSTSIPRRYEIGSRRPNESNGRSSRRVCRWPMN